MNINILAVLIATVLQFIIGFIWYGPLFGGLWGKIHGFDKLSKDVQQAMMKKMMPLYATQFLVTIVTTVVLGLMMGGLPSEWSTYGIAGFFWLGFVVPTQVSAVVFGGTDPKWIVKKIAIMAGASLLCLEVAAVVLRSIK
ncbi:MAG: DUF1761 domain-containing protein [Patescibacteria group bacterium]